jgi:signal transduction histidine kinase
VREVRAATLVEEMNRSLKLLDNFMSNALHFVRTPCNVMVQALDAAKEQLQGAHGATLDDPKAAAKLVEGANPSQSSTLYPKKQKTPGTLYS